MEDSPRTTRSPIVRYAGFRSTASGREYLMHVTDGPNTREFVMLITHAAFAAHEAKYQDAPDVCSAKLRQALHDQPDLEPGEAIKLTAQDLLSYHVDHLSTFEKRARLKV
jgi:hypothetical protein